MPAQPMRARPAAPPRASSLDPDFHAVLYRRALALTRNNRANADDLVQDTYERALRSPLAADCGERAKLSWLFRIMFNRFIDDRRRERSNASVPWNDLDMSHQPANDTEDPAACTWRTVSDEDLRTCVERLPPLFRNILALKESGRPTQSIAAELGIDSNTVCSRLFRARVKLRTLVQERCQPRRQAR